MRGVPPEHLYFDPSPNHDPAVVYEAMDGFTEEVFLEQPHRYSEVSSWLMLPPVHYEGKLLKGLWVSASMELILERRPEIMELFHTVATPRYPNIPWSQTADIVFQAYNNPEREQWFRERYPNRAGQLMRGFEHEVDFIDESYIRPPWAYIDRDIDVFCVSRFFPQKNLPIIVEAAGVYAKKYNRTNFKFILVPGSEFDAQLNGLIDYEKQEYYRVQAAIDALPEAVNIQVIPRRDFNNDLFELYSHAKVYTVGSLIEGKNRSHREALYCNTPVVMFEAFNQYIRGSEPIFPEGCGLTAPEFSAESLADTWHQVFQNQGDFSPRQSAMASFGRKNYFNQLIGSLPYYQQEVPEFSSSKPFDNLWLDLAIQANYQTNLYEFIYARRMDLSFAGGLDASLALADKYLELFDVPLVSNSPRFEKRVRPTPIPFAPSAESSS